MPPIRVLIVDDSFFMRKIISDLLSGNEDIEVVGKARDGEEAIRLAADLKPDIITMDYHMPAMNGAETTKEILKGDGPLPAIIMLSATTSKGADETLASLNAGAVDFIAKPSGELSLDIEKIKNELIFKVKLSAKAKVRSPRKGERKEIKKNHEIIKEEAAKLIIIGSSTGGPPAVEDILTAIPGDLKAAILVIQHMPEKFTKSFAQRLNKISAFRIKEAEESEGVKTGMCLIAPGNYHMEVVNKGGLGKEIHLNQEAGLHGGLRPAIDVTMKSAALNFSGKVVGIILTGMGSDGTEGMRAIRGVGGHTIAQSPDSAVIDSMPKSVIEAGLADEVIPLDKIAQRIIELTDRE